MAGSQKAALSHVIWLTDNVQAYEALRCKVVYASRDCPQPLLEMSACNTQKQVNYWRSQSRFIAIMVKKVKKANLYSALL